MLFDQSFLYVILIVTLLGLFAFSIVIPGIVKYCLGYSWSKR